MLKFLPAIAEDDAVAFRAKFERCHRLPPLNRKVRQGRRPATQRQRKTDVVPNLSPILGTANEKGLASHRRKSLCHIMPETGLEPALLVKATRPSTWRVCQFRHSGSCVIRVALVLISVEVAEILEARFLSFVSRSRWGSVGNELPTNCQPFPSVILAAVEPASRADSRAF